MSQDIQTFKLPPSLATLRDLRRLINEVERIDSLLISSDIQERTGHQANDDVVMSDQLSDFMEANELEFGDSQARTALINQLRQLKDAVSTVHVTFADTVGQEELAKLVDWARQAVHPQIVLEIGLAPELIGGAYVRTTNKVFDFSVRAQLASGRQIIQKDLEALSGTV